MHVAVDRRQIFRVAIGAGEPDERFVGDALFEIDEARLRRLAAQDDFDRAAGGARDAAQQIEAAAAADDPEPADPPWRPGGGAGEARGRSPGASASTLFSITRIGAGKPRAAK